MPFIHHEVQPGDTLWGLSILHDCRVDDIERVVPVVDPNVIQPGWKLSIPVKVPDDPPPDPDPEPPAEWRPFDGFLIGATTDRRGTESHQQATDRFEAVAGPIQLSRRFYSSLTTDFASVPSFAVDIGQRHRIVSMKGFPTRDQIRRFIASCPDDGFTTGITYNHEPDKKGGRTAPDDYLAVLVMLDEEIQASGRTDVYPLVIVMTWWEHDGAAANTTSAVYFPPAESIGRFVLGMDPYDPNKAREGWELTKPTLDLWRARGGKRWVITETGTKRTGADAARWITEYAAWCEAQGSSGLQYFHSGVGDAAGTEGWWMNDTALQAAFKALERA